MEFLDYFKPLIEWLNQNPGWAGFATFLVCLGESLPLIGLFIPGSVMMTAIGALIGAGIIPSTHTILWAIAGAIAGDSISYFIGYSFKEHICDRWPFCRYPHLIERGKQFFSEHGGKSIFIGRFAGPMRTIMPLIAGMAHMKPRRFIIADIISAVVWAPVYMFPGIIIGMATLELDPETATRFIIILLIALVILGLTAWLLKRIIAWLLTIFDKLLTALWYFMKRHRRLRFFCRALQDPRHPKGHGQLTMAMALIVCFSAFVALVFNAYQLHGLDPIDQIIMKYFSSYRSHDKNDIVVMITTLGFRYVLMPLLGLNILYLGLKRYWRAMLHLTLGAVLCGTLIELFKTFFYHPRPDVVAHTITSGSFPSGHVTLAIVSYGLLCMFICRDLKPYATRWAYGITSMLCIIIAISRLYLGVHWLTDVLAAAALGLSIVFAVTISYRREPSPALPSLTLLLGNLLSLVICWVLVLVVFNHHFSEKYQFKKTNHRITVSQWWNDKIPHDYLHRHSRTGNDVELLNLQWVDDLNNIKLFLADNGWEVLDDSFITFINRISAPPSEPQLPILEERNGGSKPTVVAYRQNQDSHFLIIIRLYPSSLTLARSTFPLWLGRIEYRMPRKHKFWLHRKNEKALHELAPPIDELTPILKSEYRWKLIPHKDASSNDNKVLKITVTHRKD